MNKTVLSMALLAGLAAIVSAQADTPRSGIGNDRTGNTTNNSDMRASSSVVVGGHLISYSAPNDDIKPMGTSTGAPTSDNTYPTTGVKNRKAIQHGQ